MATIRDLRAAVAGAQFPDKVLLLADKYIQLKEATKDEFEVPQKNAAIAPLIERFSNKLEDWYVFAVSIRDTFPNRSLERLKVQEVCRTLNVRLTQRQRRTRLDAAVYAAVKKGLLEDEYQLKVLYANKLTRLWTKRKETAMASLRAGKDRKRLTTEERAEALDGFWANIDAEIKIGELPKP